MRTDHDLLSNIGPSSKKTLAEGNQFGVPVAVRLRGAGDVSGNVKTDITLTQMNEV